MNRAKNWVNAKKFGDMIEHTFKLCSWKFEKHPSYLLWMATFKTSKIHHCSPCLDCMKICLLDLFAIGAYFLLNCPWTLIWKDHFTLESFQGSKRLNVEIVLRFEQYKRAIKVENLNTELFEYFSTLFYSRNKIYRQDLSSWNTSLSSSMIYLEQACLIDCQSQLCF